MNLINSNPLRILGIDPGSAICGWGVVEKNPKTNQLKLVDCDCIRTHASSSTAERLHSVYLGIQDVIVRYQPDEVAVEELFFVQNVKTGIVVGQARGVILLAAAEKHLPIYEYKPTQIKLSLVGYGHADKKQVQHMVKLILKLDESIKQDDTADAVAVAICHAQQARYGDHANPRIWHANPSPAVVTSGDGHPKNSKMSPERNDLLYPDLSYSIVGALFDAYKQLGSGLPERYYYSVVREQFRKRKLNFEEQQKIDIAGLPARMGRFLIDFVVENKVVVELKVGSRFKRQDIDQIMNYLRQTSLQLGIIARFAQTEVVTKRLLLGRK